jgi:hypothetical protein
VRTDDGFTVYGAVHHLHSLTHAGEVLSAPISVVGYVVDSNIPRAPKCAQHATGHADPENCNAEIPSFWLADDREGKSGPRIRVVGWARNFAVVYDAIAAYKKPLTTKKTQPVHDDMLDVDVPRPLPAVGMRVKVTGSYGVSKVVLSGMVSDPMGGVMAWNGWQVLEETKVPAAFSR